MKIRRSPPRAAVRGSAVRRNRRPSVSPTMTWRSCARSRGIASSARRISPRWSAARSTAPTTAARLFHAGYLDRPRAQLDRFPTSGSAPMVYALADRGARLLIERDGIIRQRRMEPQEPRGRPAVHRAPDRDRQFPGGLAACGAQARDVRLIPPEEWSRLPGADALPPAIRLRCGPSSRIAASVQRDRRCARFRVRAQIADGSRRNFMVEIDRGTMPMVRSRSHADEFREKDARATSPPTPPSSTSGNSAGRIFACSPSRPTITACIR